MTTKTSTTTSDSVVEVITDPLDAANKKTRVQLAFILGVDVSQARCATHLKQNLGDENIEREIRELRENLKKVKSDNGDFSDLKSQITEKSKALVRISGETPIAAAVIWDAAVKDLLRHGMDNAKAGDRKIVDTSHLHEGNPNDLLLSPIWAKCSNWVRYDPEHEDELKKGRAASNKVAKEIRESKKASAEGKPVKPTKK